VALVNAYLPQIIQWVEKNETPQDICTKLGVCTMFALAQLQTPQAGTECILCKLVVGYVETYLANNATEAQIAVRVKKLCALVGPLEMICDDLVDNELPTVSAVAGVGIRLSLVVYRRSSTISRTTTRRPRCAIASSCASTARWWR
jgi:hypothetical protein